MLGPAELHDACYELQCEISAHIIWTMFGMQHQYVIGKEKIALYGAKPRTSETVGTF